MKSKRIVWSLSAMARSWPKLAQARSKDKPLHEANSLDRRLRLENFDSASSRLFFSVARESLHRCR